MARAPRSSEAGRVAQSPGPLRTVARLAAAASGARAGAGNLLLYLDRGLALDYRRPGHLLVSSALAVETSILLWLPTTIDIPWPLILPPAAAVTVVLMLEAAFWARGRHGDAPWPMAVALGLALLVSAILVAFLTFILLLALFQGSVAGGGILPFYLVLLLLAFAVYIGASLPLFLALTLVLMLDLGVLMDSGFLAIVAVPLVSCIAAAVVLFHAVSPGRRRRVGHLFMGPGRFRPETRADYSARRKLP